MPHIDTLATARRRESAGLPTEQARAVSEAISDAVRESQPELSHLATKADLADVAAATKADLVAVKTDLAQFASQLNARFDQLVARIEQMATKVEVKELEVRILERLRSQLIWFYSVQAAFLGIGVTLVKLLSK